MTDHKQMTTSALVVRIKIASTGLGPTLDVGAHLQTAHYYLIGDEDRWIGSRPSGLKVCADCQTLIEVVHRFAFHIVCSPFYLIDFRRSSPPIYICVNGGENPSYERAPHLRSIVKAEPGGENYHLK
jgi:hypothetical protein